MTDNLLGGFLSSLTIPHFLRPTLHFPLHCLMPLPIPPPHPHLTPQITSSNLKDRYWRMIEDKYPSRKEEGLTQAITRLVDMYSVLFMLVGVGVSVGVGEASDF